MGKAGALTAFKNFYARPWKESKGWNIAFFFFVMAVISAAVIVLCHYQKEANKPFWKVGSIGKEFHNARQWRAIVTSVSLGLGTIALIWTATAGFFHWIYKKSEPKELDPKSKADGIASGFIIEKLDQEQIDAGWIIAYTDEMLPYYFNQQSGDSVWSKPSSDYTLGSNVDGS